MPMHEMLYKIGVWNLMVKLDLGNVWNLTEDEVGACCRLLKEYGRMTEVTSFDKINGYCNLIEGTRE